MATDGGDGLVDKVKEAKDAVGDKLEPSNEELEQSGGVGGASSPFSSGERPDEQPASD